MESARDRPQWWGLSGVVRPAGMVRMVGRVGCVAMGISVIMRVLKSSKNDRIRLLKD